MRGLIGTRTRTRTGTRTRAAERVAVTRPLQRRYRGCRCWMRGRWKTTLVLFTLVCQLSLLVPSPFAGALAPTDPRAIRQSDRQTEIKARESFAAGRYDEALQLFARLYTETLHPVYLRNIGRCHQKMREPEKAIHAFRDYLEKARKLDPSERDEIQRYIHEMEVLQNEQVAERKRQSPATPVASPTPSAAGPPSSTAAPGLGRSMAYAAPAVVPTLNPTNAAAAHSPSPPASMSSMSSTPSVSSTHAVPSMSSTPSVSSTGALPSMSSTPSVSSTGAVPSMSSTAVGPSAPASAMGATNGSRAVVDMSLQGPQPAAAPPSAASSFYTQWWFWTGVGVVVAGTVGTAVLLSHGTTRPPCIADQGCM